MVPERLHVQQIKAALSSSAELTVQISLVKGPTLSHLFLLPLHIQELNNFKAIIPKTWLKLATGIKVNEGETICQILLRNFKTASESTKRKKSCDTGWQELICH